MQIFKLTGVEKKHIELCFASRKSICLLEKKSMWLVSYLNSTVWTEEMEKIDMVGLIDGLYSACAC